MLSWLKNNRFCGLRVGNYTLATRLNDRGIDLKLIQMLLRHEDENQTLDYIEPNMKRIRFALKEIYSDL